MTSTASGLANRLRANPLAVDAFIAFGLTGLSLVLIASGAQDLGSYDPLSLVLLMLQTLPLVARRRWPLVVTAIVFAATTLHAYLATEELSTTLGFLVVLYTVGDQLDRRTSGIVALIGAILVGSVITIRGTLPAALSSLVQTELMVFVAWVLGVWAQDRRRHIETVEQRAGRLEHEREERDRQAITEERERIARELHDVVTHHVSVIVIQAGAAERALDRRPADARTAVQAIDSTARQALADMRRMLGILGRPNAAGESRQSRESDLAPMPGLDRLGELLEQVRAAGTPVELSVTGERRSLDPGVELSAYRIIQEALTNAMRHAPGSRARVRVGYGTTALEIQVDDDGPQAARGRSQPPATEGSGHGIIGMRERVAVFGGEFSAAPTERGFRVAARLPLGGTAG